MEKHTSAVNLVTDELVNDHNIYLVKQVLQISSQELLLSGPLDHPPIKQIVVPQQYYQNKLHDSDLDEFKFVEKDPAGENKIDKNGKLQISGTNKAFLFNYFQLPSRGEKFWVLLDDLMDIVSDDTMDQKSFIDKYKQQLLPIRATDNDIEFLKTNTLLNPDCNANDVKFVTTKSAYISFGAAIISQGTRILDDYWETLAKQQNFSTHHRVFKCSPKILDLIKQLKPSLVEKKQVEEQSKSENDPQHQQDPSNDVFSFDIPYTIVSEQSSKEIRDQYGLALAKGLHTDAVIPGQSINGSLELSTQFRVPKYHSKSSFLQATQIKGLHTPIGEHNYEINNQQSSSIALNTHGGTETKHVSRMLSNILDTSTSKGVEEKPPHHASIKPHHSSLNIKGWKFDSLPIGSESQIKDNNHSIRGLSYFDENNLIKRLNHLTPNQIKEIEHTHDCLFVNSGLQRVRKIRGTKWTKYWQYKNGLPMGLLDDEKQIKYVKEKYLPEILQHEDVNTITNELTNTDEIRTTKRVANANLLGYSNIKPFKPPYA